MLDLGTIVSSQQPMTAAELAEGLRAGAATAIAGISAAKNGTAAQLAVAMGMLFAAGDHPAMHHPPPSYRRVLVTAHRFAALPASYRRRWLAARLAGLRADRVTIGQLP